MVRALPQKLNVISWQALVPSVGLSFPLCKMGWLQVSISKPDPLPVGVWGKALETLAAEACTLYLQTCDVYPPPRE